MESKEPQTQRYTWKGNRVYNKTDKQTIHRRLDYVFISESLQPYIKESDIINAPDTDHSAIVLDMSNDLDLDSEKHGPSYWKFNNSLLNDREFVDRVKEEIKEIKESFEYALQPNAGSREKWEYMKYKLRSKVIDISKEKKRKDTHRTGVIEQRLKLVEEIQVGRMTTN